MAQDSAPEWTKWWQDDIPCRFSPGEATENAAYLTHLLGSSFLNAANHPVAEVRHPILQRWKTCGAGAFLELNTLASDLKVVSGADGFETVVHDLKNPNTCASTWHTVHAAALLGRAPGTQVERFFPQADESLPDFLVLHQGQKVMCEAKLLAKSGQEEAFEAYASQLSQRIMNEVLAGASTHPSVTVVLKNVHSLPPVDDVVRVVAEGRAYYSEGRLEYRSPAFNVFLDPAQSMASGVGESRSCFLLCPKSEKEDLRVQRPGAKASRQLSSKTAADHPGMLLLGITNLQDPGYVVSLFRRRFEGGQYPGISGAMLIHAGTHMEQPLRAPLDLIATVRNDRSTQPHPNLPLQPAGLIGPLPAEPSEEIPAYRHLSHEVRVGDGFGGLFMPDLRTLSLEMLSDGPVVPG